MPAVAPKVAPTRRTWVRGAADFASCRDPNASRGSTNRRRAQNEASAPDAGRPYSTNARAPKWVNIPRALFSGRTGREPRYHLSIQEKVDWAYMGEPLAPLKGYPGVMWVRPKRKKSVELPEGLEPRRRFN